MKKSLYFLSIAIWAIVGCETIDPVDVSLNDDNAIEDVNPFTIEAFTDEIGTKATIPSVSGTAGDPVTINWASDDRICVSMYETGEYTPWEREFRLTGGAGSTNGTFSLMGDGTPGENTLYNAIYPKYENTFYDSGESKIVPSVAKIKLLTSYTWSAGTILAPMVAYGIDSDKKGLHFKHVGGAVMVTMNSLPKGTTKVSLTLTSDGDLTGNFNYTVADIANPTPSALTTAASNGGKTVAFTFDALGSSTNRVFYFPTPTLTAPEFTIKVYVGEMLIWQASTPKAQPDITRGGLLVMQPMTVSPYHLNVRDEELAAATSLQWSTGRTIYIGGYDLSSLGTVTVGGKTYNQFYIPKDCVTKSTDVYYKGQNGCEVKLTFTPAKGTKEYNYKTDGFEIIPEDSYYTSEKRVWVQSNIDTSINHLWAHMWENGNESNNSTIWGDGCSMTATESKYDGKTWYYSAIGAGRNRLIVSWGERWDNGAASGTAEARRFSATIDPSKNQYYYATYNDSKYYYGQLFASGWE